MDSDQMVGRLHVSSADTRDAFAHAMSRMFAAEVPLYGTLVSLVNQINNKTLENDGALSESLRATDDLARISLERHGAIRLGTARELLTIKRVLAVMGMFPTGYYDLSVAGIPVHSTCFRPHDTKELSKNPFRLFVSLLRPELIEESRLLSKIENIINSREIFSQKIWQHLEMFECYGGLTGQETAEFVEEAVCIFRWSRTASLSKDEYEQLLRENAVLADIVAFPNPHINHLTPRTLDIDGVQRGMQEWDLAVKDHVEGPPKRKCPIVLRQTSFKAVEERVVFPKSNGKSSLSSSSVSDSGSHTARFGEIEQRGAALTREGRELYDSLISSATKKGVDFSDVDALEKAFCSFPDSWEELRSEKLVWFKYYIPERRVNNAPLELTKFELDTLVDDGWVKFEPVIYEDFLPISAAGIFRSNMNEYAETSNCEGFSLGVENSGKEQFERALDCKTADEFELYEGIEKESIERCRDWFERLQVLE